MSHIALSSRVRLARNLQDVPFTRWAAPDDLLSVVSRFKKASEESEDISKLTLVDFPRLQGAEKRFLCERRLISREFMEGNRESLLALNETETLSIMINEEDHLRLQSIRPGIDLIDSWDELNSIDDDLEGRLRYAFDSRWGYLTACPTNVGTGLRCSVMLHLPGLVLSQQIDKVLAAAKQLGLAVRGYSGEGSDSTGHLYQISNQITLGSGEEEIIKKISSIAVQVAKNEEHVQRSLWEHARYLVEDKVWRAYGILNNARMLDTQEALERVSDVRFGVCLGLIPEIDLGTCNELFIYLQRAHLQRLAGRKMDSRERDIYRADLVRKKFHNYLS